MIERDEIPEIDDVDRRMGGLDPKERELVLGFFKVVAEHERETSFWERVRLVGLGATAGVLIREIIVRLFS